jgi:glycosyltransferase involved in cell wall biosynthesis
MKMQHVYTENDLEIVVATKDRINLDFLLPMFPFAPFNNFNILIVNQSKDYILESDFASVRVINSTEIGLSKSRNLGINNAAKKICLIADDDVIYLENFEKEIVKAFNINSNAAIITFNHQRIGPNHPQNQNKVGYQHNIKSIWNVSSIEIAFCLGKIKEKKLYFDENFGLGSFFETAEELLFLRNAIKQHLDIYYYPSVIVLHPLMSSGKLEGTAELVYARSALYYKINTELAYLWLLKYVFFLYRNNYIKKTEWVEKLKIGLAGIRKIKELEKLKE